MGLTRITPPLTGAERKKCLESPLRLQPFIGMAVTFEAHLAEALFDGEKGLGQVIVVRKKSPERIEAGVFLVDVYCLGVREAFLFEGTEAKFRERLMEEEESFREMPAAYGRKFVEEAIAYARRLGFAPHRSYKKAARVFGGLKAAPDLGGFSFGKEGKPFYVQSRYHSADDARRIIDKLHRICGEGNYDFLLAMDEGDSSPETVETLLLSEAWFDPADAPPGDKPTEAARRAFEDFAATTDVLDEGDLNNCLWESRGRGSTLDRMMDFVRVIESKTGILEKEERLNRSEKSLLLTIVMTLMNLVDMDKEEKTRTLEGLFSDSDLPPALVERLGRMADDEKIAAALGNIIHPDSNVTLLPVTLETIDEAAGHYLFIAVEQRF